MPPLAGNPEQHLLPVGVCQALQAGDVCGPGSDWGMVQITGKVGAPTSVGDFPVSSRNGCDGCPTTLTTGNCVPLAGNRGLHLPPLAGELGLPLAEEQSRFGKTTTWGNDGMPPLAGKLVLWTLIAGNGRGFDANPMSTVIRGNDKAPPPLAGKTKLVLLVPPMGADMP